MDIIATETGTDNSHKCCTTVNRAGRITNTENESFHAKFEPNRYRACP